MCRARRRGRAGKRECDATIHVNTTRDRTRARGWRSLCPRRGTQEKPVLCKRVEKNKILQTKIYRLGLFAGGVPPVPPPAAATAAATAFTAPSAAVGFAVGRSTTHSASGTISNADLFWFGVDSTSPPFTSTTGVHRNTSAVASAPRIQTRCHRRTLPVNTCACVRCASRAPRVDIALAARSGVDRQPGKRCVPPKRDSSLPSLTKNVTEKDDVIKNAHLAEGQTQGTLRAVCLVPAAMRAGACARVPASGVSHAVPGPSSRCDACAFRGAHRTRWRLVSARSRLPRRAPGGVRATTAESNDTGLAPRVFDDVEDIRNRSSSDAERTNQREALALAVLASTRALDPSSANGFQQLTDAASFVGWRVISLEDGSVIGEVRHALAMAGGEVVAQMGDLEMDEHDLDDELGVADLFSPAFAARGDDAAFDDRDDDEDDWDETEESSGSFDDDSDDDWEVIYEGEDDGATSSSDVSSSDDFSVYSSGSVDENNTPPLSLVLRIRGERFVEGAGGVVNVEPVARTYCAFPKS